MDITIEYLNDHPEFVNTIAKWHYEQWHHILPDFTLEKYIQFLSTHYRRGDIPSLFVALYRDNIIGTAALEDHDTDTHPELSPWLASLYVEKNHRRKGAGITLVKRVIKEAQLNKVKKLYLFTLDQERFLKRFGWTVLFLEEYYGERVSVMVLDISPQTPSR